MQKPLRRWTVPDVAHWLGDIGLDTYKETFSEQHVNGLMLSKVTESDLDPLFNMDNDLHKRVFLQALNYTKTHGVKLPTDPWEFKSAYSGYATFLLYSMAHTPRLTLIYMYMYDSGSEEYYRDVLLDCRADGISHSSWLSHTMFFIWPDVVNALFVRCYLEDYYWVSWLLIVQCWMKLVMLVLKVLHAMRNPETISVYDYISETVVYMTIYLSVRLIWWAVPTLFRDALFLAQIYFSPIIYAKAIRKSLSRLMAT